jgi:uncharacterized glyoxalase superfamily protein PhnB
MGAKNKILRWELRIMTVKLKRVSIFVEQIKRALDFYRMLGLEIPESANEEHHVDVEHNGIRLAFGTWESAKSILDGCEEPVGHRMELAFQFDSREALDELYRQLTAKGYTGYREPQDTPWGGALRDRKGSRWQFNQSRRLREKNHPDYGAVQRRLESGSKMKKLGLQPEILIEFSANGER